MATTSAPIPSYSAPFPAPSRSSSALIGNTPTDVTSIIFTDKILITLSQHGKLSHWIHVPLASATAVDPMAPGFPSTSSPTFSAAAEGEEENHSLLPMPHLTATTLLGGTRRADEVVSQTLATTIATALLTKSPREDRLLVVGLGLDLVSDGVPARELFDEAVGLVLRVL